MPLNAAQQSNKLASFPLALYPVALVAPSALLTLSQNPAESPQSRHLLAQFAIPSLSLASLLSQLQYVLQYSQSARRVASTVVVPAAVQPGISSALYASASLQFEAAVVQPASQVGAQFVGAYFLQAAAPLSISAQTLQAGAPLSISAQPSQVGAPLGKSAHASHAGAPLGMGANPSQAKAPLGMGAQFSQAGSPLGISAHPSQATAQYVAGAQPVAQVRAPFAFCAQLATPAEAQPGALAADYNKEDTNALLRLATLARFCESAGTKIRGFVADLELYLLMCARPVHH